MKRAFVGLAAAMSLVLSGTAMAVDGVSEPEIHLVRGIADKTNLLLAVTDLAAEKSSNANIRAFAAKMAEQYAAALTEFSKQATSVGIANIAPPRGAQPAGGAPGPMPPEATQGAGPAGAPPSGSAPGNAPAGANGPGSNGMGAGGPPGGAGGPGGPGGGVNPKEKMINLLKDRISQFQGTQFDEVYLLTALQVTENLERQVMAEVMTPTSNKVLLDASKKYIQPFAENAILMQEMLTRSGVDKVPEQPGKANAEARSRLSIGDLFGISINN
jgi:hypothetical protein